MNMARGDSWAFVLNWSCGARFILPGCFWLRPSTRRPCGPKAAFWQVVQARKELWAWRAYREYPKGTIVENLGIHWFSIMSEIPAFESRACRFGFAGTGKCDFGVGEPEAATTIQEMSVLVQQANNLHALLPHDPKQEFSMSYSRSSVG